MIDTTSTSRGLTIETPAKINLSLRVLGRRPDGFHDLESVVAAVSLFDTLSIEPAPRLELTCDALDVPADDSNLVMRAARALAAHCGVREGASLGLTKRIPAGRGFGGGSSDAAAALSGLNTLWRCGLGPKDLAAVGAKVGSDVPLFFGAAVAVVRGRGELIEPVHGLHAAWHVALVWPDFGLPTSEVYAAYDRLPPADGLRPAATEILARFGAAPAVARDALVNDLEPAADVVRAGRLDVRAVLEGAGAAAVGMTGSGSAYFALAADLAEAERLVRAAQTAGADGVVARLLVPGPAPKEDTP
jgi:4-diphosphocytidyl-2-C-methyl-D-erythritol kinase